MNLPIVLITLFLFELFLIFLVSKNLIKALSRLFYRLTRSEKMTVSLLAIIFLPGTIIHELSHAITAGITLVHVGDIEFMPEIREKDVKLGSAQIGESDPLRRALIGIAPVLVGIAALLGISFYLLNHFSYQGISSFFVFILIVYGLFVVSNTMFSSKKDMEGSIFVLAIFLSIGATLYLTTTILPNHLARVILNWLTSFFSTLSSPSNITFLQTVDSLLVLPLSTDLVIIFFVKLILKKL